MDIKTEFWFCLNYMVRYSLYNSYVIGQSKRIFWYDSVIFDFTQSELYTVISCISFESKMIKSQSLQLICNVIIYSFK